MKHIQLPLAYHAWAIRVKRGCKAVECVRCHRALKDPKSVERGMGPVCWGKSGGDVFEKDLEATHEEWTRRERLLRNGGEIDLGVNWQHIDFSVDKDFRLPVRMRVSLRYKDGAFEAYGLIFGYFPEGERETVLSRGEDLKQIYADAVKAGPASTAAVVAYQREQRRKTRARQRRLEVA